MKSATAEDIANWAKKHFDVKLSKQYISEMMLYLGFHSRQARPTPSERLKPDFLSEMISSISAVRERIGERYDKEEVLAEDELMLWNSGTVNTSYGLVGGYATLSEISFT